MFHFVVLGKKAEKQMPRTGSSHGKNCLLPGGIDTRKSWEAVKSKLPFYILSLYNPRMVMPEQDLLKYQELILLGFQVLAKDPAWPKACEHFEKLRQNKKNLFLAGNGGSAANANHLANDLIYGVNQHGRGAFRVHSLAANPSVLTCLGNDVGFENVFSNQLEVLAESGDLLLVFSGSGNSPNIIQALKAAKKLGVTSVALLGYDGGGAKALADLPIHFPIHDMQAVEDLHMIVGHLLMKVLQG